MFICICFTFSVVDFSLKTHHTGPSWISIICLVKWNCHLFRCTVAVDIAVTKPKCVFNYNFINFYAIIISKSTDWVFRFHLINKHTHIHTERDRHILLLIFRYRYQPYHKHKHTYTHTPHSTYQFLQGAHHLPKGLYCMSWDPICFGTIHQTIMIINVTWDLIEIGIELLKYNII